MEKVKVKLIGEDGNIFNLVGIARKALMRNGQEESALNMTEEVYASDSYDEALRVIGKYVDIE